jgi:hypothetical protein
LHLTGFPHSVASLAENAPSELAKAIDRAREELEELQKRIQDMVVRQKTLAEAGEDASDQKISAG